MKLAHLRAISQYISDDNLSVPMTWPELVEARDELNSFIERMDKDLDEAIRTTQKRADKMKARDVEIEEYI